jgi:hypothetical protein
MAYGAFPSITSHVAEVSEDITLFLDYLSTLVTNEAAFDP